MAGRKKIAAWKIDRIYALKKEGLNNTIIAQRLGLHSTTVDKYVRENASTTMANRMAQGEKG